MTMAQWNKNDDDWLNGDWHTLNAGEMEMEFENNMKVVNQVFRYFREREQYKEIFEVAQNLKSQIDKFKPYVPLAVSLRKDGMAERHWAEITKNVGFQVEPKEEFALKDIIEMGLVDHITICEEVGERASKEYNIEKSLKKMKGEWEELDFLCPSFKKSGTNTISGIAAAMDILDEHIVTAQAMTFSPFKGPFEEEIGEWAAKLLLVSDTLEEWVKCQSHWVYLQPVFDSPDIQKQL
jgi:dynein heavy chain